MAEQTSAAQTAGDARKRLGQRGEDVAAAYLVRHGCEIVARNWRTRAGEIDLVAREQEWLVFVEVRARRQARDHAELSYGTPEESITPRKQQQLVTMVEAYLFASPWDGPWRIDVIAIEFDARGAVARLSHLRDAVGGMP